MDHLAIDVGGRESQTCRRSADGRIARRAGHDVRVVPATLAPMRGVGARGVKTDRRDAQALSEVSCRIELPSVHISSSRSREIKAHLSMHEGAGARPDDADQHGARLDAHDGNAMSVGRRADVSGPDSDGGRRNPARLHRASAAGPRLTQYDDCGVGETTRHAARTPRWIASISEATPVPGLKPAVVPDDGEEEKGLPLTGRPLHTRASQQDETLVSYVACPA